MLVCKRPIVAALYIAWWSFEGSFDAVNLRDFMSRSKLLQHVWFAARGASFDTSRVLRFDKVCITLGKDWFKRGGITTVYEQSIPTVLPPIVIAQVHTYFHGGAPVEFAGCSSEF